MTKQALKKGSTIKKRTNGLSLFKEKKGINDVNSNIALSNADKPMEWLIMPKGFMDATRLPGFPCGYISMIGGFSDSGKSTLIGHVIVAAQRQGFATVIYDTENSLDWNYLINMGFNAHPVYGDIEVEKTDEEGNVYTETENKIINYTNENDDFIYFNNTILAEMYGQWDYSTGKETKTTKRKTAVIEDIAASIKDILKAQEEGIINQGVVFVWDSIGSINSFKSYKSSVNNNMFDAGSVSVAFSDILNNQIPKSRKVSSKYTNTFVAVSKIWLDSMSAPMAAPIVKYKNGNTFFYACHGIICHVGGTLTTGTKKLKATSKYAVYKYGMETKIKIVKSHLPSPYDITYEGPMICTSHGIIAQDELAQYQKDHVKEMLEQLNNILAEYGDSATEEEVSFIEDTEEE